MERRHGESAAVVYLDVTDETARAVHADLIATIQERNLIYPVTVVDGVPMYDGAVSYPAILRAIESRLQAASGTE